jgi:two-component system phosphate regulon response regulator PhoB
VLTEPERILIVDDDPACRTLLDAIFQTHGFEVTSTDSVLGATALLATFAPTVILLDIALPYRSGASWLAQLRADPATASIPVVVISALPELVPRERRDLAQAVVRKPFRTGALVSTIQAVCRGERVIDREFTIDSRSIRPLGSL